MNVLILKVLGNDIVFTVSGWDNQIMRELAEIHGVSVNPSCVTCGFDWRSGQLNPSLSDTFANIFLRPPNLGLAQICMMNDYKAGCLLPRLPVPASKRVLFEEVNRSPDLQPSLNSHSTSKMLMVPDLVERVYVDRKRRLHERKSFPANCVVRQEYASNESEYPLKMDIDAARSRRAAGQISAQRTLSLLQEQMDQSCNDDDGWLSDEGDAVDWNVLNGDDDDGMKQKPVLKPFATKKC